MLRERTTDSWGRPPLIPKGIEEGMKGSGRAAPWRPWGGGAITAMGTKGRNPPGVTAYAAGGMATDALDGAWGGGGGT